MHEDNSENELNEKSSLLHGKRIILGVTGSISAVENVKLIHELRRHGAYVNVIMTESAQKIIHPYALEYASGNEVVTNLTGKIEHVRLANLADLVLIAPATANTISKAAMGIDDTPVTSLLSNTVGRKPIIMVPAMHEGMIQNPILLDNIKKLKGLGVEFIEPIIEENKAKMADYEYIVARVIRSLNSICKERKVAVVGGSSFEFIDDVRVITNLSSGETTAEIIKALFYLGAQVEAYLGLMRTPPPNYVPFKSFNTVEDIINMIPQIINNDMVIVPAALSDFTTNHFRGKIPSDKDMELTLKPTRKFLKILRNNYSGIIVGFKAEKGIEKDELIERAMLRMNEYKLDYIIANRLEEVGQGKTIVYLIDKNNVEKYSGEKNDVFIKIIRKLCQGVFSR